VIICEPEGRSGESEKRGPESRGKKSHPEDSTSSVGNMNLEASSEQQKKRVSLRRSGVGGTKKTKIQKNQRDKIEKPLCV